MRRNEVIRTLKQHRDELTQQYGVESLALFGSVARDQDTDSSDIDLLVEFNRPKGMDFKSFQKDTRTIRAVELNFIIIGEAANSISDDVQNTHLEIPWPLMRAMRNRLVHAYFSVDPKIL
jgi:uncharacterized protein